MPAESIVQTVLIACTLRSGSNLLCEILTKLGFGRPAEHFQVDTYQNTISARLHGDVTSLPNVIDHHAAYVSSQKGLKWHGTKWTWSQFQCFQDAVVSSGAANSLEQYFPNPKWLYLRRRDLISQAISLFLAQRSQSWIAGDAAILPPPIEYDFHAIWSALSETVVEDQLWQNFFAGAQETTCLTLCYEDIASDANFAASSVTRFLAPGATAPDRPPTDVPSFANVRMNTELNEEFRARFLEDLNAGKHERQTKHAELSQLVQILTNTPSNDAFMTFAQIGARDFSTIRKLDLTKDVSILGSHAFIEGEHFLDGYAVRMDPGAKLHFAPGATRTLVEFVSHPWSGTCRVTYATRIEDIPLYGPVTTMKPHLIDLSDNPGGSIEILGLGERSPFSKGSETWVQRIWVRR